MQRAAGKPLHRTTLWRRKKNAGKVRANRRGRRLSEQSEGELIAYAGAIIGLVVRDGWCHAYLIKSYPRLSEYVPGGDNRARFHQPPERIAKRLAGWASHPAYLAIAAVRLAKINYATSRTPARQSKTKTNADARTTAFAGAISEYDAPTRAQFLTEYRKEPNALWVQEFLDALPADAQHAMGLRPLAINRPATPQKILGMSKQLVAYYCGQPAYKNAVRLVAELMGDHRPKWMREQGMVLRRDLMRVVNSPSAQSKTTPSRRRGSQARDNS